MKTQTSSLALQRGLWFSGLLAVSMCLAGCGETPAPPPGTNTDTPEMKIDQGEEMKTEKAMNEKDVDGKDAKE